MQIEIHCQFQKTFFLSLSLVSVKSSRERGGKKQTTRKTRPLEREQKKDSKRDTHIAGFLLTVLSMSRRIFSAAGNSSIVPHHIFSVDVSRSTTDAHHPLVYPLPLSLSLVFVTVVAAHTRYHVHLQRTIAVNYSSGATRRGHLRSWRAQESAAHARSETRRASAT